MANYFWRTLKMYAPRYISLVRIESMDFDPTVNRYFEAQYVENGESSNTAQTSGIRSDYDNMYSQNVHSGDFKEYPKTTMNVVTEGETHNEGTDVLGPTVQTETFNNVKDATDHTGSTADNGSTSAHDSSHAFTESTSHADNSGTSANTSKSANKTAPMSASGDITMGEVMSGSGINGITGLDFSHATGFAESDGKNSTVGSSESISATTTDGNGSKFSQSQNTHSISTNDTNVKTGSITTNNQQVTNGSENAGTSYTSQTSSYGAGSVIEKYDNSSDNSTSSHTASGSSHSSSTGINVRSNTSTNRYTGREGLTPQEGMMSATDYLTNYSVAFKWFVNKLDSCFIMLYDI